MNKYEKEVQQALLDREKAILKRLEETYQEALDEINTRIAILLGRQDADLQHVIYQVEYQRALRTQIQSILEQLQAKEFETVSEYLTGAYEDGFIGTMYNLQKQGIPVVTPIDQEQVIDAIKHESKIKESMWTKLGKDIKEFQKNISSEISRGISTGMMFSEIARNLAGYARVAKNKAMRIVRTEGHRIQCKAAMNACNKAKAKGADVVKQWDASLDGRTRPSHRRVDGEIRELEEPFSNGLMYPGDPSGSAKEVVNCRCALLQRARWAVGEDFTKWDPEEGIVEIKAKDYDDFKNKYNDELLKAGYSEDGIVVNMIKQSDIDKAKIKPLPGMSATESKAFEDAHKRVLELAMKDNSSHEVAIMLDADMGDIGKPIFGTATEIDLNVSGRSKAKYVVHNHPNNSSFSNRDIKWILKNDNVRYFSIVKNNGNVETLIKTSEFDMNKLAIEYNRLVKKYKNDIANNKQKGYSKVIEVLLRKTKSGLVYER